LRRQTLFALTLGEAIPHISQHALAGLLIGEAGLLGRLAFVLAATFVGAKAGELVRGR